MTDQGGEKKRRGRKSQEPAVQLQWFKILTMRIRTHYGLIHALKQRAATWLHNVREV